MTATIGVAHAQKINGAGAPFPQPIYSKWFSEYSASHPGVQINYQSIGSGGGVSPGLARAGGFWARAGTLTGQKTAAPPGKLHPIFTLLRGGLPPFYLPTVNHP